MSKRLEEMHSQMSKTESEMRESHRKQVVKSWTYSISYHCLHNTMTGILPLGNMIIISGSYFRSCLKSGLLFIVVARDECETQRGSSTTTC